MQDVSILSDVMIEVIIKGREIKQEEEMNRNLVTLDRILMRIRISTYFSIKVYKLQICILLQDAYFAHIIRRTTMR